MRLRIDHVTLAASRLETLQQAFAETGLTTDYGGPHSNGITHMSLLGFTDGSYIELISTLAPAQASPWWHTHISGDGGLCAWALEVADVAAEAQRLARLGVTVDGPHHLHRQRPDGRRVEWDLAFIGDHGPGALLPFIIKDRTPRDYRVSPSVSVRNTELTGVALIVLAVDQVETAAELFCELYDLASPVHADWPELGLRVAIFVDRPFVLAAPLAPQAWLRERLHRFGPSPCACLIGTSDMALSLDRLSLTPASDWDGRQVAWFATPVIERNRIGIISL